MGEHPFMWIKNETVYIFNPGDHPAHFRQQKGRSGIRSVNVVPAIVFFANQADLIDWVYSGGTCGANGRNNA